MRNDLAELIQLTAKERQYRVTRQMDKLAALYFEDATVTTSWNGGNAKTYFGGGAAMAVDTEHPIINRTGTPVVYLHGDKAIVELPSTTTRWIPVNGEEAVLDSYMRLVFRCEFRAGRWGFVNMASVNEGDTLTPVIAGRDLGIDADLLRLFRHSYRYLAYTRNLNGIQMSDDLLGIDHPEHGS